jgi:hypothetical protein
VWQHIHKISLKSEKVSLKTVLQYVHLTWNDLLVPVSNHWKMLTVKSFKLFSSQVGAAEEKDKRGDE